MSTLLTVSFSFLTSLCLLCLTIVCIVLTVRSKLVNSTVREQQRKHRVIAFFHPFCSSGGGGERVLWAIIKALVDIHKQGIPLKFVIYTVDPPKDFYKTDLLKHVKDQFSIKLQSPLDLSFVHLNEYSHLLAPATRFSMLVESWRTMQLAYIALRLSASSFEGSRMPRIFFDTTGCAFTYLVANILFGCDVISYVHYPTISTDMLSLVWKRRRATYNNQEYIAASRITTYIKLVYYTLFAIAYGVVGSLCTLVLVNSTWTFNHIHSLWWIAAFQKRIRVVYPPCRVMKRKQNKSDSSKQRERVVLSIGQFRPEKDHELQIDSLSLLFERHPELKNDIKLVLVGSCRGKADEQRLEHLRRCVQKLNLAESVEFIVNQPYTVVQDWLQKASVGIHTMWNEHFGIGIVEMMSAGLIVIAHKSGGPQSDILVELEPGKATGFLASTKEEYADVLYQAFTMEEQTASDVRMNAQLSSTRFTDEVFSTSIKSFILTSGILKRK